MKITIESTTKIVNASGVDCRVWEGATETGVKVQCLIPRIAALAGEDLSQFEAELQEQRPPSIDMEQAFPARLIL
jgi:hypothetical protein